MSQGIFLDIGSFNNDTLNRLESLELHERLNTTKELSSSIDGLTKKQVLSQAPLTWWEEVKAVCILSLLPGVPIVIALLLFILTLATGSFLYALSLLGLVMSPLLLPVHFNDHRRIPTFLKLFFKYFSFKALIEDFPGPAVPYIITNHPHGIIPYTGFMGHGIGPALGIIWTAVVARLVLSVPVFKHFTVTLGIRDASRTSMINLLQRGPVLLSVGGVAEVFNTNLEKETAMMKTRKGVIKLAITQGAPILPSYTFGSTQTFSVWMGNGWLKRCLIRFSRRWGVALVFFWGRWGLPIPYRATQFIVIGKPINVTQQDDPDPDQVERVHAQWIQSVTDLFDRYKSLYGWEDRTLEII